MNQNPYKIELPHTRISHDENYVANIGLATYVFAGYEGLVCEVIDFFIHEFRYYVARESALSSGGIRERFLLVLQDSNTQYSSVTKNELESLHDTFYDLINRRNALIHGRPATAPSGAQVLNYQSFKRGKPVDFLWQLSDVQDFTVDVSEATYSVDKIRMRLRGGGIAPPRPLKSFPKDPSPSGRIHLLE